MLRRAAAYLSQSNLPGNDVPARELAGCRRHPRGGRVSGAQAPPSALLPMAGPAGHRYRTGRGIRDQRGLRRASRRSRVRVSLPGRRSPRGRIRRDVAQTAFNELAAELRDAAVARIGHDRSGRHALGAGGLVEHVQRQAPLLPVSHPPVDLGSVATTPDVLSRFGILGGVIVPVGGQEQVPGSAAEAQSVAACRLTPTWQLPVLPSAPQYLLAPGESTPSLGKPVSSSTNVRGARNCSAQPAKRLRTSA